MDKDYLLLSKLQDMREDDFSRDIVIPLMRKLGFSKVEFNGGVYEKGKDIIAYKMNPFGDEDLYVIQVKKFQSRRNFQARRDWQEIIYQLRQCKDKPVATLDGTYKFATHVLFLTPFQVETRLIEEQLEAMSEGPVKIIGADDLVSLIGKAWPSLYEELLGEDARYQMPAADDLFNKELMRALDVDPITDYTDYYSDLNFFLGGIESKDVISSEAYCLVSSVTLPIDEWPQLQIQLTRIASLIGFEITVKLENNIASEFSHLSALFDSPENNRRRAHCNRLTVQRNDVGSRVEALLRSFLEQLNYSNFDSGRGTRTEKISEKHSEHEAKLVSSIKSLIDAGWVADQTNIERYPEKDDIDAITADMAKIYGDMKSVQSLRAAASKYSEKAQELSEALKQFFSIRDVYIEETRALHKYPELLIEFESEKTCSALNERIAWFRRHAIRINKGKADTLELREFLNRVRSLLSIISALQNNKVTTRVFALRSRSFNENRFSISAHSIFACGSDVAVYGEAGAGKSTTLHVYANRLRDLASTKSIDDAVVFFPLNRVMVAIEEKKFDISAERKVFGETLALIKCFLVFKGIEPTESHVADFLKFIAKKDKVVFMLDGLDEAARTASWILDAISQIRGTFPNAQVIVSSRDCSELVKEIEFLGITLLPFTKEQLQRFIIGWFDDKEHARLLWEQIKTKELFDVAKNPLLATIICSLYKNGIPIPENEPDVYRKKVELLCGHYDRFKGIERLQTPQGYLERACRKIGFRMHIKEQREASYVKLVEYYYDEGNTGIPLAHAEIAIRELIDPCNILRRNPGSETFGFEHLRIQEFLAAEELAMNRGLDIIPLLTKEWWKGALYLYAFRNDFSQLIEDCYHKTGGIRRAEETLRLMIKTQSVKQQNQLRMLLDRYKRQDSVDRYIEGGIYGLDDYGDSDPFIDNYLWRNADDEWEER